MKYWAEKFYKSKSWKECRLSYLENQEYICERCGKFANIVHHKEYLSKDNINNISITLGWKNLEAVCQDCHNKEHIASKDEEVSRYKFDRDGNILVD